MPQDDQQTNNGKSVVSIWLFGILNLLFYEPNIKEQGTKQKDFWCHFLKQLAKNWQLRFQQIFIVYFSGCRNMKQGFIYYKWLWGRFICMTKLRNLNIITNMGMNFFESYSSIITQFLSLPIKFTICFKLLNLGVTWMPTYYGLKHAIGNNFDKT